MTSHWLTRLIAGAVLAALAGSTASAQTSLPPPQQTSAQAPPTEPDVDKIRGLVNRPPRVTVDQGQMRIYVEVIAKWPSFAEYAKGYDFVRGATRGGNPMTHNEFLSMVTPRDMTSSAGVSPFSILQSAIVNWLGHKAISKGLEAIGNAKSEREINEIRARIDRELAALRGGGEK